MEYLIAGIGALLVFAFLYPKIMVGMDKNITNVTGAEASDIIGSTKDLAILDVRTHGEFQMGHIPGAKIMPVTEIGSRIGELSKYKNRPLLVYCASGSRSPKAVLLLSRNSFGPIYHMNRGLNGWPGALKR